MPTWSIVTISVSSVVCVVSAIAYIRADIKADKMLEKELKDKRK